MATLFLAGAARTSATTFAARSSPTFSLGRSNTSSRRSRAREAGTTPPRAEGHDFDAISATVIQIQALQAAENVGIPVPAAAINDAQEYLKTRDRRKDEQGPSRQTAQRLGRYRGGTRSSANRKSACCAQTKDELCENWLKYCQTEIPIGPHIKFGRDELTHYYYAQAAVHSRRRNWSSYRTAMFDHLQSSQNKDGSWPAGDGISVGPVYATALWCTVLQLGQEKPSIAAITTLIAIDRDVSSA